MKTDTEVVPLISEPAAMAVAEAVDKDRVHAIMWTDNPEGAIARKLVFLLQMYPHISTTMLQVAVSPQLKVAIWKPVLNYLIEVGIIYEYSVSRVAPNGQYRTYKVLCLIDNLHQKPQLDTSNENAA